MSGTLGQLMVGLTLVGSGWAMIALVPLYAAPPSRRFARWLAAVWTLTAALVFVLKAIVQRPRPVGPALWGAVPTDYSFPSGHAAGAFAFAGFVALLCLGNEAQRKDARRWAAVALTFAVAGGIAVSRVYLGVHHVEDVIAGALIGGSIGALAGRMYSREGSRLALGPPAEPPFGKGLAVPRVRDPQ